MSNSRILNNPRQLSQEEQVQLSQALDKWYPTIIQSYNTTLFEMMANPTKKALVHTIGLIILVIIGFSVMTILNIRLSQSENIAAIVVVIFVLIFNAVSTYLSQYRQNQDLQLVLTLTRPNATKYDYESSPVIRDKMMRNAYRNSGGGSSVGNGLLGGLVGYGLGSSSSGGSSRRSFGRRRRR